jgi:hypothetical protein
VDFVSGPAARRGTNRLPSAAIRGGVISSTVARPDNWINMAAKNFTFNRSAKSAFARIETTWFRASPYPRELETSGPRFP